MTFHVGQKVTLKRRGQWIDVDGVESTSGYIFPRFGEVYVIRSISTDDDCQWLTFVEIRNVLADCLFDARLFRPVVDRKTDISIFKKLLTPCVREREAIGT